MGKVIYETDESLTDRRIYHTRCEVSAVQQQAILNLPGVECSPSGRYNIIVWKGHAFTWEEIDPAIVAVLEKE
jgi:hypothetical protein